MFILVSNLELNCDIGGTLCSYSCFALTQALKSLKYTTLMSVKCIEFVLWRLLSNDLFLEIGEYVGIILYSYINSCCVSHVDNKRVTWPRLTKLICLHLLLATLMTICMYLCQCLFQFWRY